MNEKQKERIFHVHRKHSDRYKLGWTDADIWGAIEYWNDRNNFTLSAFG